MIGLQDILRADGLEPKDVNVILHSPRDGDLLRLLPGLVQTRRAAFETYQAAHSINAERALAKGRPWLASFVKVGEGRAPGTSRMAFAGLYRNAGGRNTPRAEIEANPEVQWLHRAFGSFAEITQPGWDHWMWFDLTLSDRMAHMQGRLHIEAKLSQSYVRLAENLPAPVDSIERESRFDADPPGPEEMILRALVLRALPPRWAARLREWRGVYLIVDEADGARYVGSAYGEDNLLGRWRAHVAGAAGVTKGLAARDPERFRFSILELVAPTASAEEVIGVEQGWIRRLDTVRFGLNLGETEP